MQGWATWANLVTLVRLALIPASVLAIAFDDFNLATVLFVIIVASDLLDGYVARSFNQVTPLGGLLDHACDAIFVATATAAFAQGDYINPYLSWLILLAFVQYMLDSKALRGQTLRASRLGRLNGVAYFVLVGTLLGLQVTGLEALLPAATWFAWVLVVSSVVSMADRLIALFRSRI